MLSTLKKKVSNPITGAIFRRKRAFYKKTGGNSIINGPLIRKRAEIPSITGHL